MEELNFSIEVYLEMTEAYLEMTEAFRRTAATDFKESLKLNYELLKESERKCEERERNRKAQLYNSQRQFLLHLLQCFPQAQRGEWSKDTWKIVGQVMNEYFPDSNFTIQQLMQHEQDFISRQCLKGSGRLSGFHTEVIPYYAAPVAVYKGPHLEAEVETKSATALVGVWGDAAHNAPGIIISKCSSLSASKEGGFMNNLNSSSTVPQSVMSGDFQVQPVNFHSFKSASQNILPCGVSCLDNCENKSLSNNDSGIGGNHSLSAPLSPDPASNYQQPHKNVRFYRNKPIGKSRGKRNCKKLCAAKSDFSVTRCIKIFKKLPGFKEYHMEHVLEIFSDELYREAFISMKRSHKIFWLRSKLEKK